MQAHHCVAPLVASDFLGFPERIRARRHIEILSRVLSTWLFKPYHPRPRLHRHVWSTLYLAQFAPGCEHLASQSHTRTRLRTALRGYSAPLASAFLRKDFRCEAWKDFVREPFLAIESPAFLQTWYVGKVMAVRKANNCFFYSPLLRFRKHLSTMVCNSGTQAHRPRYRAWSAVRAWQLSLIPQISGSEPEMLDWEALETQQLQPPTQQVAGSGRFLLSSTFHAFPQKT